MTTKHDLIVQDSINIPTCYTTVNTSPVTIATNSMQFTPYIDHSEIIKYIRKDIKLLEEALLALKSSKKASKIKWEEI